MPHAIGWSASVRQILEAGWAVRHPTPFDERARAAEVEQRVAEARRYPWWVALLAIPALLLPIGGLWASVIIGVWFYLQNEARQRGKRVAAELEAESNRLRAQHRHEAEMLAQAVTAADSGNREALAYLLDRWERSRPEPVARVALQLQVSRSGGWQIAGTGVPREEIPAGIPRMGRASRTVIDKRKAGDIDEDLVELNAAAVLSALLALFGGSRAQRVRLRLTVPNPTTGQAVPWITLDTSLNTDVLRRALARLGAPTDCIRALGGDVGRCRSQRLTPARELAAIDSVGQAAGRAGEPTPTQVATPVNPSAPKPPAPPVKTPPTLAGAPPYGEADGSRAVRLDLSLGTLSVTTTLPGATIPPAPAGFGSNGGARGVPSQSNVQGRFAEVARRFADYAGDPSARFVPFQAYWSHYSMMTPGQLKFYFKWRNRVRSGEAPRTDLSYIFVHTYELLHVIGAADALDTASQLERLWLAYRQEFPKLDSYLARWITDLYATELDSSQTLAFLQRAVAAGGMPGPEELLLLTDQFWARGDYPGMPRAGVATLAGDARLGDNKFYREHNNGPAGNGWLDRAYREALAVADRAFQAKSGSGLRDYTIAQGGLRPIVREPFAGAVYDWRKKTASIGKIPALTDDCVAVTTYRNAVRHAENLLRRERGFTAKLRGVELSPEIASALERHFAGFVKATRPKPKVTIDAAKARELAQESADVRARLLEGLEGDPTDAPRAVPGTSSSGATDLASLGRDPVPSSSAAPNPADVPAGLLTDLVVVQAALADLMAPARAVLQALMAAGWEAPAQDAALVSAAGGALVAPLVDAINESAVETIGDVLIVHEKDRLVLQDDFRDEVHWVLTGSLDGFLVTPGTPSTVAERRDPAAGLQRSPRGGSDEADRFGPLELRALALIARGGPQLEDALATLASASATTPILLVDRVNECALSSSYGDLVLDATGMPPTILDEAQDYVTGFVARLEADTEPTDSPDEDPVPSPVA